MIISRRRRRLLLTTLLHSWKFWIVLAWIVPPPQRNKQHPSTGRRFCSSSDNDKFDLSLVLIDHYDSFTYNLVDLLAQQCTHPPLVVLADDDQVLLSNGGIKFGETDGIVLSPGPGNPYQQELSQRIIQMYPNIPILGVCLGHQLLAVAYGQDVALAPNPVHGQVQEIAVDSNNSNNSNNNNNNSTLFDNMPKTIQVTRYHSLQVVLDDGAPLKPTAWSQTDRVLMALQHEQHPHYGVQFHPESIGTEYGFQIIQNFLKICQRHKVRRTPLPQRKPLLLRLQPQQRLSQPSFQPLPHRNVYISRIPSCGVVPETVMQAIASHSTAFWLDTSSSSSSTSTKTIPSAISILGYSQNSHLVEYDGHVVRSSSSCSTTTTTTEMDILSFLHSAMTSMSSKIAILEYSHNDHRVLQESDDPHTRVPFDFCGGYVGYLGYEVRHDTAPPMAAQRRIRHPRSTIEVPIAAFVYADRNFVYHHDTGDWYLVGVAAATPADTATNDNVHQWMLEQAQWFHTDNTPTRPTAPVISSPKQPTNHNARRPSRSSFLPNRSRHEYSRNFEQCMNYIRLGESYELCLTNQLQAVVRSNQSPLDLYRILRRRNPAPYAAFLHWKSDTSSFAICCSSPERFISVKPKEHDDDDDDDDDPTLFQVEAKPIKGTIGRVMPTSGNQRTRIEEAEDEKQADRLRRSVKDRAENLMIVDLLRNDLNRVCQTGTVHVSKLMDIESFATVHQMVSTIRGSLNATDKNCIDALKACFPGGSMTGAPKLRTLELLDELEGTDRGPYSGCLGYISLNGAMDMNIVIRSAVLTPAKGKADSWNVRIGAGGAITALSEDRDEYEEMLLKASVVIAAVQEWEDENQLYSVPHFRLGNERSLVANETLVPA